jgi:hypothetical protein
MVRIRSAIGLEQLSSPSTLCKAFNRLDMVIWRVLLNLSITLFPTNGVVEVDASGFNRSHTSKRTKLAIQQLKMTSRKYDSRIALSLHRAWNARLDADLYGERSQNETETPVLNENVAHSSAHDTGGSSSVASLSAVSPTISTGHS